jgi:hypothetical protein
MQRTFPLMVTKLGLQANLNGSSLRRAFPQHTRRSGNDLPASAFVIRVSRHTSAETCPIKIDGSLIQIAKKLRGRQQGQAFIDYVLRDPVASLNSSEAAS